MLLDAGFSSRSLVFHALQLHKSFVADIIQFIKKKNGPGLCVPYTEHSTD